MEKYKYYHGIYFSNMIISIINMKGGVGKTTLTVNLALGLAKFHNKKVLLVDLDPQFNATQYLINSKSYLAHISDRNKLTIRDVFVDRLVESAGTGSSSVLQQTKVKPTKDNCCMRVFTKNGTAFLDLIPSRLELMEVDSLDRGIENKLKIFLDKVKGVYDYILIDCPPTISIFTKSAFIASDSYMIPIKPDYLSSIGLSLMDRAVNNFQETYGKSINYLGLTFIMVQKHLLLHKKTMQTLKGQSKNKCFINYLSHSTKIAGTVEENKSIYDISGRYPDEMKRITDEFLKVVEKQNGHK